MICCQLQLCWNFLLIWCDLAVHAMPQARAHSAWVKLPYTLIWCDLTVHTMPQARAHSTWVKLPYKIIWYDLTLREMPQARDHRLQLLICTWHRRGAFLTYGGGYASYGRGGLCIIWKRSYASCERTLCIMQRGVYASYGRPVHHMEGGLCIIPIQVGREQEEEKGKEDRKGVEAQHAANIAL